MPASRVDAARLVWFQAAQVQQARELAMLRQQLAAEEKEVAQIEQCVNNLEGAVYEDSGWLPTRSGSVAL